MRITRLFLLLALLATTATATASEPRCPEVDTPPAPVCVATPDGPAYADSREEAAAAAVALGEAAQRYRLYFGRSPAGALILSSALDGQAAQSFARAHGLEYAQVWLPARAGREMSERAMRQAGLDRSRMRRALDTAADQAAVTLSHEVGHAMYAAMYWPDAEDSLQVRYGTPAPDWLDEAVAIFMEPSEAQARHLASFIDAAKQRPRTIPSLSDFLQADHPVLASPLKRALDRAPRSGSGVQMMIAGGDLPAGLDSFYGQSLLIALFLAETSGDPRILAPISGAIAGGATFEQWLASDGARLGLPEQLPALQSLWEAWLQNQVLQPGPDGKR